MLPFALCLCPVPPVLLLPLPLPHPTLYPPVQGSRKCAHRGWCPCPCPSCVRLPCLPCPCLPSLPLPLSPFVRFENSRATLMFSSTFPTHPGNQSNESLTEVGLLLLRSRVRVCNHPDSGRGAPHIGLPRVRVKPQIALTTNCLCCTLLKWRTTPTASQGPGLVFLALFRPQDTPG